MVKLISSNDQGNKQLKELDENTKINLVDKTKKYLVS